MTTISSRGAGPSRFLVLSFLTLAGAGLLAGCGGKGGAQGGFAMPPTPVEVAEAVPRTVIDKFEAVGTIEAGEAITVAAEIDGRVVALPFREGGDIKRGEVIARLDDTQLRAERDRAEAVRDRARVTHDRVKAVVDQGAGAPQDLDDASSALKVAQADLDLAEARLAKTRITAPFAGIVGSRRVSVGAFVRPGQAITDLARVEELRVNFSAPERYLGKLSPGAEVSVSTTAYPGYSLTGEIDVVDPVLDPATRSANIMARVKNPDRKFRPGMSADIQAVLSERPHALTVPSEAVFVDGSQAYTYVVKPDSTVTRTALTLGTRLADAVEVLDGLSPHAMVVATGHQKLYDGAKVMPVNGSGGAGADSSGAAAGAGGKGAGGGDAAGNEGGTP